MHACLIFVIARACLKKLISGGFVPAVSRTQVSGEGEYGKLVMEAFAMFPFTVFVLIM